MPAGPNDRPAILPGLPSLDFTPTPIPLGHALPLLGSHGHPTMVPTHYVLAKDAPKERSLQWNTVECAVKVGEQVPGDAIEDDDPKANTGNHPETVPIPMLKNALQSPLIGDCDCSHLRQRGRHTGI